MSSNDTEHDILIHAGAQDLGHKWVANLADDELAYWRVSGTPRQTEPGQRIWFEQNGTIHARGEIVNLEDGRVWFDGARETHVPCLDDAPRRGFTYIDPLLPRLQEAEWNVEDTGEIVMADSGSERVTVDRDVLEELVNVAKGDLERLVQCDGYREGDDVVDDLVETIEAAERSLDTGTEHPGADR